MGGVVAVIERADESKTLGDAVCRMTLNISRACNNTITGLPSDLPNIEREILKAT